MSGQNGKIVREEQTVRLPAGSILAGVLGNVIWLVFGGIVMFIEYVLSGLLLCLTVIGIPFGIQILKLAGLVLWPFGKEIVYTENSGGCLCVGMNILWILLGGFWIAIGHFLFGAFLCVTIVGIPFGLQHFKLAAISFAPFGVSFR